MKALIQLRKSRRRLLIGAVALILGAITLIWAYPAFGEAWATMRHTNSTKDIPTWVPPELRGVLEHEIEMVHSEFYEQASLMGLGLVLLLCGVYLCIGSRTKLREQPRKG